MSSREEYLDNLSNENATGQGAADDMDDLQEIQELLLRTDDEENLEEEIEALVQGITREEERTTGKREPESVRRQTARQENGGGRPKKEDGGQKAEDKKQERARKAAAKKAAKEEARRAKKEEKQAKKAAKTAKSAKEAGSGNGSGPALETGAVQGKPSRAHETTGGRQISRLGEEVLRDREEENEGGDDELLFDTSVLDAIVSKAGLMDEKTIKEAARRSEQYQKDQDAAGEEDREEFSGNRDSQTEGEVTKQASADDGSDPSRSEVQEVDIAEADLPDFPTIDSTDADLPDFPTVDDLPEQEEDDLDGIGEAEAENKGLFDKVMNLLTEEEEGTSPEDLEEVNAGDQEEGKEAAKDKKGKKEKKAKKAKPKKEAKPKKAKKAKPKKPKKSKEEKGPKKKIPWKKIVPVVLLCVSIGIFILVVVQGSVDYLDKKAAREAYARGDYQTCYQSLFNRKRSEAEEEMYVKAESILYIRLWLRKYEMFVEEGSEVKALDSLIQTVHDYPGLYAYADQYSAGNEVYGEYTVILNILADKYGLSESQVLEIAAEPRDIVYTQIVTAIANGISYDSWKEQPLPEDPDPSDVPVEELPDVLPEESDMGQEDFIGKF